MKRIIITSSFLILIYFSFSQVVEKKDSINNFHFKLSTGYLSNYLFNGRSDSLKTPYSLTTLELKNDNGLSFDANLYYLLQSNNKRFDFFEFNGSYQHNFTNNFSGGIFATKYFNSNQSTKVNSGTKGSLGAGVVYDFDILRISTETDLLFSTKTDLLLNIELDKELKWNKNEFTWTFNPIVDINFSSIGYYESSLTQNSQRKGRRRQIVALQNVTSTSVINPGVRMMDFEISLPISLENNQYGFRFVPTFVSPINSVFTTSTLNNGGVISTIDSTPYSERFLKSKFFTSISFFIKF
jgi:hypothetical protein